MPSYTFPFQTFANNGSAAGAGTIGWTTPGNAVALDGVFATGSAVVQPPDGFSYTNYLVCTNPNGLVLPANETVVGIQFTVQRKAKLLSAGNSTVNDTHVYAVKGGVVQTSATDAADTATFWPLTVTAATYGGAASLFGVPWVNADFGSGFGVAIAATINDPAAGGETAYIDYVSCTLTTTVNAPGGSGNHSHQWPNNALNPLPQAGMIRSL